MAQPVDIGTCSDCMFFSKPDTTCRLNPPVRVSDEYAHWPDVKANDWCGQWKQLKEAAPVEIVE